MPHDLKPIVCLRSCDASLDELRGMLIGRMKADIFCARHLLIVYKSHLSPLLDMRKRDSALPAVVTSPLLVNISPSRAQSKLLFPLPT